MRKAAIGCGFTLALVIIAFLVVLLSPPGRRIAGAVLHVMQTDELNGATLETSEDVIKYLEAHPDRYALAAWDVGAEEQGLFHDADTAWPLASTVKIIPLTLASEEIAAGRWSVSTPLPEVEALYLPGTDGNAHPEAKEAGDTSTIGGAIHAMIRFSDNAATDALLFRLGRERVPSVHPLSGTTLLAATEWKNDGGVNDAAWEISSALLDGGVKYELSPSIPAQEQMARELDNKGTARDFARRIEQIFTDDEQRASLDAEGGPGGLERAHQHERYALARKELSWPMEFESNQRDFVVRATKGGSLAGVLTSASFAETKSGQRRVVALFLHDLPFATWVGLSKSFAQQQLERELLSSPDALQRLRPRLAR
jgi:hypothetical protein